jgi:hypothetical protein
MRQIRKLKVRRRRSTRSSASEFSGYSGCDADVDRLLKRIDAVLDEGASGRPFHQR